MRHYGKLQVSCHKFRAAFSLIEMMAVVAIMAIGLTITVSGFKSAMDSQRVATAATQLQADLTFAAQTALRDNVVVYVQFFKEMDPSLPGDVEAWRSYQIGTLMNADDDKLFALGEKKKFPSGVVLAPSPTFSDVLYSDGDDEGISNTRKKVSIGFRPDGVTTLPKNSGKDMCLMVINEIESERAMMGKVPSNSRIILINPHTSSQRLY